MIEPLELPALTAAQAARERELVGQARALSVELGNLSLQIHLKASPDAVGDVAVHLEAGPGSIWIALADWSGLQTAAPLLAHFDLELPDAIRLAVLEAAWAEPLDRLQRATGLSCRIAGVGAARDIPAGLQEVGVEVQLGDRVIQGALFADEPGLELLERWARSAPRLTVHSEDHLPLCGEVVIGASSLSLSELSSLRPGDVVLMDDCTLTDGPSACVRGLPETWTVQLEEGAGVLQEPVDTAQPLTQGGAAAGEIDVRFVTGRTRCALGEHRGWRAGMRLPLESSGSVELLTQEQFLAAGELIQIQDRWGVVVRSLRPSSEVASLVAKK